MAGRSPKYQIHLKSETGQIFVLLINKEHNSEPVVVQVPPPPEIAAALKREVGGDILSAATSLSRTAVTGGIKRERDAEESCEDAAAGKRARYDGESEPGSEDYCETSSEREQDSSLDTRGVPASAPVTVGAATHNISAEFTIPNIQSDIPGLEDILHNESKWTCNWMRRKLVASVMLFSLSVFGPLIRLSPPPTEKDYCYNLDTSEGVCDLFDVL